MHPSFTPSSLDTLIPCLPSSNPSTPPDDPDPALSEDFISPSVSLSPPPPNLAPRNRPEDPIPTRRHRKKARIFEIVEPVFQRKVTTIATIVQGLGLKLSTIPNIMYNMDKCKSKDPEIEFLHRLLFNCSGQPSKRKTNIRQFSGFVFATEKDKSRAKDKLRRAQFAVLRKASILLDVPVRMGRQHIMESIMKFLEAPCLIEGRCDLAQRDKDLRMEKLRKKAEKARAAKLALQKNKHDSDEDGDEDLEYTAKPWIVIAKEKELQRNEVIEISSEEEFGDVEEEVLAGEGTIPPDFRS